jgi:hypothetical protein
MFRKTGFFFLLLCLGAAFGCQQFDYRQAVTLTAGTDAGAGFQVRVRVGESAGAADSDVAPAAGQIKPDFADVRFTEEDGKTVLPHWLESVTGTSPDKTATFWVRVNDDLNTDRNIYIYYGSAAASSASDGGTTFDFYDDFEKPFETRLAVLENPADWQTTPTYDGSGQGIHPDIVQIPGGWNGYEYWMAMTPYPGSDDQTENPSVLASHDGETWEVPAGLTNPLIGAPPCDHNNDTDIIFNPYAADGAGELMLYYLDTRRAGRCGGHEGEDYYHHNFLQMFTSSDGVTWAGPTPVIDWDLDVEPLYLSPAILQMGEHEFYLWVSNGSNTVLLYESDNGIDWHSPSPVNIADNVWHLNVSYIPGKGEYWMLTDYPSRSGSLRWAVSTDRVNWTTYPNPVLVPGVSSWDTHPYRGAVLYDDANDLLRIWYSAYKRDPVVWHTGYMETDYSEFLTELETPFPPAAWRHKEGGGSWATSTEQVKTNGLGGLMSGKLEQSSTTSKQIVYRSESLGNNFRIEWDMYDDMDDVAFKLFRLNQGELGSQIGAGVYTGSSADNYVFHNKTYSYTDSGIPRSTGWHTFGITLRDDSSAAYFVDGAQVGSEAGQFDHGASVSAEGFRNGDPAMNTVFYLDDIRVRKTAVTDPSIGDVGPEEVGPWPMK